VSALVTGASSGLGAELCRLLVAEGVAVSGTARDRRRVNVSGVLPVELNLADMSAVNNFAATLLPEMRIDLLVNCAGTGVFSEYSEMPTAEITMQLDVMLEAPALLCRAALPGMTARGHGCIANVSSLAARFPLPCMAGYNMAKAGLSALSSTLAEETRGAGVCVIDFQPGDFNSGFFKSTRRFGSNDGAWKAAEKHLNSAPSADTIAKALLDAIRNGRSGTVTAGGFFQTKLAPIGQKLLPNGLFKRLKRMYTE
jgi:short-subunit dehydrogenase